MIYWEKQKKIKALYENFSKPVRMEYGLTQMEYSVLMFLHRNPGYDTASAIVQTGKFAKSHVSSAIKGLEERGLVTKEYMGNNNKTIHLKLTDQAGDKRYVQCLFEGFTEEERMQIRDFFDRICQNAEDELQKMR